MSRKNEFKSRQKKLDFSWLTPIYQQAISQTGCPTFGATDG
jgi:hypothetical protein